MKENPAVNIYSKDSDIYLQGFRGSDISWWCCLTNHQVHIFHWVVCLHGLSMVHIIASLFSPLVSSSRSCPCLVSALSYLGIALSCSLVLQGKGELLWKQLQENLGTMDSQLWDAPSIAYQIFFYLIELGWVADYLLQSPLYQSNICL